MKRFKLLLTAVIIMTITILFNSWFIMVVYNLGVEPIMSQFGAVLPHLPYCMFILIWICMTSIYLMFKKPNKDVQPINNGDLFKVFEPIASNIAIKLIYLGLLYLAYSICF